MVLCNRTGIRCSLSNTGSRQSSKLHDHETWWTKGRLGHLAWSPLSSHQYVCVFSEFLSLSLAWNFGSWKVGLLHKSMSGRGHWYLFVADILLKTFLISLAILQAFYLARTGRPGPVLIDVPKDVQQQLAVPDWAVSMAISGYMSRLPPPPKKKDIMPIYQALKEVMHSADASLYVAQVTQR